MNVPGIYLLGLDLGGTRLKAIALTPEGVELARETAPSNGIDWQNEVGNCVAEIITRLGNPLATGVAAPGLAAADERSIAFMPGRLEGLDGLDWADFLNSPTPVPVLNDAHAALLGEVWLGAAQDMKDVILLTLGTGVGGAILSNGQLLRGRIGRAGHLGHLTVDAGGTLDIVNTPGSLEDAVGNHTLGVRSAGRYFSTADLVADVARGDSAAMAIWARTIRDLAAGIASLINCLDPETILLGGGIAEAGDALFIPLAAELDRFEWRPGGHRVQIAHARLGDWAGAYGAAARALEFHQSTSNKT
jgi:glucokinase